MKERKRKLLCVIVIVLALLCQIIPVNTVDSLAAGDGWEATNLVTDIRTDKDTYILGEDDMVTAIFNVRRLPEEGERYADSTLVVEISVSTDTIPLHIGH